jgi:hypothetical protein
MYRPGGANQAYAKSDVTDLIDDAAPGPAPVSGVEMNRPQSIPAFSAVLMIFQCRSLHTA